MTTTIEPAEGVTLSEYVKARPEARPMVEQFEAEAEALVEQLYPAALATTPAERALRARAVLEAGANLWGRRRRLTEAGGYIDGQAMASPDRPTRDPLDAARYILAPLLGPGIA